MAEVGVATRWGALRERAPRFARPVRDALIVVGVGRALWYFFVQDIRPWEFLGVDARAYWRVDLAHPYAHAALGDVSSYLYSPAFAQAISPLWILPFPAFFALWTVLSVATFAWLVRPWPWAIPILILPIVYELCVGNIHFLIAAGIVLGFRRPWTWALSFLTKITPGVGVAWFAFRREWRRLRHRPRRHGGDRGRLVRPQPHGLVRLVRLPHGIGRRRQLLLPRVAAALRDPGRRRLERLALAGARRGAGSRCRSSTSTRG